MPEPKCPKCNSGGKKGKLLCCKCIFHQIKANLAEIQPENHQNVQKKHFWQKAPGVNGLITWPNYSKTGPFVVNLGNLSETSPKTPGILHNLDFRFFLFTKLCHGVPIV